MNPALRAEQVAVPMNAASPGTQLAESGINPITHPQAVETLGMSPGFGAILLTLWLLCGVATARVMGRRGHDFRPLVAIGIVLGPLLIPLVREYSRQRRGRDVSRVLHGGRRGNGPVDVLVGITGAPETVLEAVPLLDQLGSRLGRVAIAALVDFDSAESDEWDDAKRPATLDLEIAAALMSSRYEPGYVLVGGAPPDAFARHARANDYDLLVITGTNLPVSMDGGSALRGVVVLTLSLP